MDIGKNKYLSCVLHLKKKQKSQKNINNVLRNVLKKIYKNFGKCWNKKT